MDNIENLIPVEAVQERDIDLLLLEEIISNAEFRKWLIELFGLEEEKIFEGAWHSLTQGGLGESDLAIIYKSETNKHLLLLENKINAGMQPDQAKRYKLRGENYKENGECNIFYTVLIAPEVYLDKVVEFDFKLSYEQISDWFSSQGGLRFNYKSQILQIAIEKQRRGYRSIPDEDATNFWTDYYNYASINHANLNMVKPPAKVPKGSDFVVFNPINIGVKGTGSFMHKLKAGNIDFQINSAAAKFEEMQLKLKGELLPNMEIVKAKKTLLIRLKMKSIDNTGSFQEQINKIENAFILLNDLYGWVDKNIEDIKMVVSNK